MWRKIDLDGLLSEKTISFHVNDNFDTIIAYEFPAKQNIEDALVRLLWDRGGATATKTSIFDVYDELANIIGLSAAARLRPSKGSRGQARWRSEVGFCKLNLVRRGVIKRFEKGKRGIWSLTDQDRDIAGTHMASNAHLLPDESPLDKKRREGALIRAFVKKYKRNRRLRKACIDYYGMKCAVARLISRPPTVHSRQRLFMSTILSPSHS